MPGLCWCLPVRQHRKVRVSTWAFCLKHTMQLATIGHSATMTSLEISELVESRHDKIKQSIERLAATFDGKGNPKTPVITLPPMGEVPNQGPGPKMISVYLVGKRDSLIVVAQNCPEFTAKLVDRWDELEKQVKGNQFNVPTTFAGALRLALEQAELIEKQTALIAQQAPAVAYVEKFVKADGLIGVREAAKSLGLNQNAFVNMLIGAGLMFRENGHLQAYAGDIDAGRFVVQAGTDSMGKARASTKFTAKGLRWVAGKLRLDQLFQD